MLIIYLAWLLLWFGSEAYNSSMAECDFSSTIFLIKFEFGSVGFCEERKTRESEEKITFFGSSICTQTSNK